MKKLIISLAAAIILCSVLIIGAGATDYTHLADDLSSLGLIKGTGDGYELDQVPDRAQAVTMLIRIMGEEKNALEANLEHPFRDVPEWAAPYVAYAYEKGYTDGIGGGYYGSYLPCDAEMYAVFLLRALGYGEEDWGYWPTGLAYELGILNFDIEYYDFTRNELITMSFLGLGAKPADGEYNCQLEKMLAQKAVPEAAAKPILERINRYLYVSDKLNELNLSKAKQTTETIEREGVRETGEYNDTLVVRNAIKGTEDDFEGYYIIEAVSGVLYEDITEEACYYTDGKVFENSWGEKYYYKADSNNVFWYLSGDEPSFLGNLLNIESIQIKKSGEQTIYEINVIETVYSSNWGWYDENGDTIEVSYTWTYSPYATYITFDKQERISEISESVSGIENFTYSDGETEEDSYSYSSHFKVDAYGDDVVLVFPEEIFTWPEFVYEWDDYCGWEEEFQPIGKGSILSEKANYYTSRSNNALQCPDYRGIGNRLYPSSR